MALRLESEGAHKVVIGLVHLSPLPGTPYYEPGSFESTVERAIRSARALSDGGADGCLVQTVDRVYAAGDEADPARVAAVALVVRAIADEVGDGFATGVQIMRNAITASLAVAHVAGGSFVRATALVGATMSPSGLVQANPLSVAEYRRHVGQVALVADVASMHYRWHGKPRPVGKVAHDARVAGAEAVAVSDPDADRALDLVAAVRAGAPGLPVLLAGGTDHDNVERLLSAADGAFVGSCLERDGWGGEIDGERVRRYVDAVRSLGPSSQADRGARAYRTPLAPSTGLGSGPMENVLQAAVRAFNSEEHLRNILDSSVEWLDLYDETGARLEGIRGRVGARGLTAEGREIGVDMIEMDPGSGFPRHVHPGDHVLYGIEGRGGVIVNDELHVIEPGTTVFIAADQPHAVRGPERDRFRFLAFGVPHNHLSSTNRMQLVEEPD